MVVFTVVYSFFGYFEGDFGGETEGVGCRLIEGYRET